MNTEIRNEVLDRDDWECQDCGADVGRAANDKLPTAEIHHKTPQNDGGTDDLDNLVTLCPNCHSKHPGREKGGGGGRPLADPLPEDVLGSMRSNRCYVAADLVAEYDDVSRGTIRNRLDTLVEEGRVKRREHANGTVTYRLPE